MREPTKINDGGAAFPRLEADYIAKHGEFVRGSQGGMSLRDWFAGQALAGYFAAPHTPHRNAASAEVAGYMYDMADAMIAAREAPNA